MTDSERKEHETDASTPTSEAEVVAETVDQTATESGTGQDAAALPLALSAVAAKGADIVDTAVSAGQFNTLVAAVFETSNGIVGFSGSNVIACQ